jgi:phospholipid/cholesterol/gamma-HCH transport system substrate-binding protein
MTGIRARVLAPLVGVSVALSGCSFSLYSTTLPGGASLGSHSIDVTVHFSNVLDLVPQSAVKVNDVSVGRVEDITLDGWFAKVKLQINGDVSLPANAFAQIQQTSVLGEKYVQLIPPINQAPSTARLASGADIPLAHTGTNPDVEEVLGALSLVLNGGGLAQINTIVTELNKALTGKTSQIRDLLDRLTSITGQLDQQKQSIVNAITSVDQLASTLNAQKQVLTDTLDTLPRALRVLSNNTGQLTGLLVSLSDLGTTATKVINGTQINFVDALKELQPVADSIAATGSNLTTALKVLLTFPFPPNVLGAIKGDYVNANFTLNLNLSQLLTSLTATGLSAPSAQPASTAKPANTQTQTQAQTQAQRLAAMLPDIPGTVN